MSKSDLETLFLAIYRGQAEEQGLVVVDPQREVPFHPRRKWRFDFAWVPQRVAVEIDGGIFVGGKHIDPLGGHGDRTKANAAVALGWKVLRYDARHLSDDPAGVFVEVMAALGAFTESEVAE